MGVTTARAARAPFVPFAIVAVAHVVALATHVVIVSDVTKPLLMPALLVALLVVSRPRATIIVGLTGVALVFSWIGDVLLALPLPGDLGFLLGLGGFFLAHVAHVVLFSRRLRIRRPPLVALVFVLWWIALLAVLAPHLGTLLVPVALYGLTLGASAALGLGCNRFIAGGAIAFLVSDTILALKFFYPGFSMVQQDAIIMLLYCVGQGLIVYGVTRATVPTETRPRTAAAVV